MIAISTAFLLIVLSFSNGKPTFNKQCPKDTIDFATKVENSSVVVYGKTKSKILYEGNDSMFYATFQVDCILKGPVTERDINITQAGRGLNKTFCQDLPVGHGYTIAFLEPQPLNVNDSKTFIPSDFVEVPFEGNSTSELLANTCNLHQMLPLGSSAPITDVCPGVSTNPYCIYTTSKTHLELTSLSPMIISGGSHDKTDHIRSKSGSIQVDVDRNNGIHSINISILLILMAISFVRLN